MANFFKNLLRGEPHDLSEVRADLDSDSIEDRGFISLLKQHHDYLEESIDVLMGKDATDSEKQFHAIRFFRLVEMHGRAEEETLYVQLRANVEEEARLEGFSGQDEHDIAFQLERELKDMGYESTWNEEIAAKARVAAGLVQNHIKEEESEMFAIAERDLTDSEMETMRFDYIEKCRVYLDDSMMIPPAPTIPPESLRY